MKKSVKTLYIVTFVLIICLPHLIFFLCRNFVDTNNYENREYYESPIVGVTPYTEFAGKFESFYNDRIPFRNQLISMINNISYFVFKDTTGDQVMIGKDGWLFIEDPMQGNAKANYLGEGLLTEEELKAIADNLLANEKFLNDKGIEFIIFISPNKSRVYPEYMPEYMGEPAEKYQLQQILDYLRANTDLRIVYDYDDIMTAKGKLNPDYLLFHKADTHWNNLGAYVGASSLMRELGIDVRDVSDISIEEVPGDASDLGGMLHMKNCFLKTDVDYRLSGYDTNEVTELEHDGNDVLSYVSNAPDDRTIYVCRDSFGLAMAPYVGANFKKVYFKHQNYYSVDNLNEICPDVFVLETVERAANFTLLTFDATKSLQ